MKNILRNLLDGRISIDEAENQLKLSQFQELGDNVKFDTHRKARVGVCEAVYSQGKTDEDLLNIINNIDFTDNLIITRLPTDRFNRIKNQINEELLDKITFYKQASILTINKKEIEKSDSSIGIITAGTADVPVAEESRITIEQSGHNAITTYDVGVAGIHRLLNKISYLVEKEVDVIIVVAGMEGALPSVVAGLVDIPVIAVPTSTGYGVGEGGFTALFAMLQSCAPGISVVNIDNGYGAAVNAITIVNQINKH